MGNILFQFHTDWDKIRETKLLQFHTDWDKTRKTIFLQFHTDWDKIRETKLLQLLKIGIKFTPISSIIYPLLFAINCSPKAPPFFLIFYIFLLIIQQ